MGRSSQRAWCVIKLSDTGSEEKGKTGHWWEAFIMRWGHASQKQGSVTAMVSLPLLMECSPVCVLLGWFFHSAVSVECLKLLLNPNQWIGKFAIIQNNDGLFNPLQKVRGKWFILLNHFFCFNSIVKHLWTGVRKMERTVSWQGKCGHSPPRAQAHLMTVLAALVQAFSAGGTAGGTVCE